MNTLQELRDKKAEREDLIDFCEGNRKGGYLDGWNALEALKLPVKFAEWLRHECVMSSDEGYYFTGHIDFLGLQSEKALYKYWIENVLKLE